MRSAATVALTLIGAVPVALLVTFLAVPFWSWLEKTTGIESLGHSGPAQWCFVATYVAVLAVLAVAFGFRRK